MALVINNIEGVNCLKGEISSSHVLEVIHFFKTLIELETRVVINLTGLKRGQDVLEQELKKLKSNLVDNQELIFYNSNDKKASLRYQEINNPLNFYRVAA